MERLDRSQAELDGHSIERQPGPGDGCRYGGTQLFEFLGTLISDRSEEGPDLSRVEGRQQEEPQHEFVPRDELRRGIAQPLLALRLAGPCDRVRAPVPSTRRYHSYEPVDRHPVELRPDLAVLGMPGVAQRRALEPSSKLVATCSLLAQRAEQRVTEGLRHRSLNPSSQRPYGNF